MSKSLRSNLRSVLAFVLVFAILGAASARQTSRDVSRQARQKTEWVRDGVVYEIFPRAFSPEGNFLKNEELILCQEERNVT